MVYMRLVIRREIRLAVDPRVLHAACDQARNQASCGSLCFTWRLVIRREIRLAEDPRVLHGGL